MPTISRFEWPEDLPHGEQLFVAEVLRSPSLSVDQATLTRCTEARAFGVEEFLRELEEDMARAENGGPAPKPKLLVLPVRLANGRYTIRGFERRVLEVDAPLLFRGKERTLRRLQPVSLGPILSKSLH